MGGTVENKNQSIFFPAELLSLHSEKLRVLYLKSIPAIISHMEEVI